MACLWLAFGVCKLRELGEHADDRTCFCKPASSCKGRAPKTAGPNTVTVKKFIHPCAPSYYKSPGPESPKPLCLSSCQGSFMQT